MTEKPLFADALAYEGFMGRWSIRLAPLFAEFAKVGDGGRLLDVGCGTGSLTRTLAGMTRRAEIVGIDAVAAFVEYAREQVKDRRVSFDVGDAQALPYPAASFDSALSCLVFHFIPDAPKAAAEMRRVTRPGGTAAACTWELRGLEMSALFWDAAAELDPAADAKRFRPLTQAGQLAALWQSAGFREVEERLLEITMDFASFDDYWRPQERGVGPTGAHLATLAPVQRDALKSGLEARLRSRGAPGPFTLRGKVLAVRGLA
jgi:ubiquinone/menaquinone biosynthesis C-methylase UbiE